METKVVLYPTMGVSHMIPMIQLAKLFINHGVSVDVAVINSPITPTATTKLISQVSSTNPEISFNLLPPLPPLSDDIDIDAPTPFANICNIIRSNNRMLQSYLQYSESKNKSIAALVVDFFCVDALDVATELGIPAYIFFPTGANNLAVFLSLPELDSTWDRTEKDFGKTRIIIPGVPLLHASDLPREALQFDSKDYKLFMNVFRRMVEAKGIVMNTFQSLEPGAVISLLTRATPPIYCIGPLVTAPKEGGAHPYLRWLDAQPVESVVFLSFGSNGKFSVEQLREIALGIEKSGQKFLWVVRNPANNDPKKAYEYDPLAEPDLDALLPEGFLDRTKQRGIVIKSWAPQVEILNHESVGGFVSHCGWSSVLEAITNAVPVICWPLFAEQRMNRVFLIDQIKIGVELRGCDQGLVSANELADKLKLELSS